MLEEVLKHKYNKEIVDIYDNWNIDFDKPLEQQIEELHEDIIQITFARGYSLDVGWYPAYNICGQFKGVVLQHSNWDNPIYTMETNNPKVMEDWVMEVTECVLDFILR